MLRDKYKKRLNEREEKIDGVRDGGRGKRRDTSSAHLPSKQNFKQDVGERDKDKDKKRTNKREKEREMKR